MSKKVVEELFQVAAENGKLLAKLQAATSSLKFVEIAATHGYIFAEHKIMEILKAEGKTKESQEKVPYKQTKIKKQLQISYSYGVWVFEYLERHKAYSCEG